MKGLDELFVVAWMMFGVLLTPLFFIAFDFWAGVRKAKKRGEIRSSYGYRKTIDKIAKYFNALMVLSVCALFIYNGSSWNCGFLNY